MKNLLKITCSILLSVLLEFPCLAQGLPYYGPGMDEAFFFPIGWSEDGKRLGYGMFYTISNPQIGEDIAYLKIFAQDLVSDAVLWETNKTWITSDPGYPNTADVAWNILNEETEHGINYNLEMNGIKVPSNSATFTGESDNQRYTIPYLIGNDEITIQVEEEESGEASDIPQEASMMSSSKSYEIHLVSKNLGEKKISEGNIPSYGNVFVRGFVINPDESRIVFILHKYGHFDHPEFDTTTSEYVVIGGHLRAGFKFMPK